MCALLYAAGSLRGQKLKTALERHYETRLDPQSFHGSLNALVERGLVECETDGIHDVYRLSPAGVESHYAWLTDRLNERAEREGRAGNTATPRLPIRQRTAAMTLPIPRSTTGCEGGTPRSALGPSVSVAFGRPCPRSFLSHPP